MKLTKHEAKRLTKQRKLARKAKYSLYYKAQRKYSKGGWRIPHHAMKGLN